MAASNPSSVGYAAIWNALTSWPAFIEIVLPGPNTQINMQAAGFRPPINAQTGGDRSAVELREGRLLELPYQANSKWTKIVLTYPLQVMSNTCGIDKIGLLNTVILQALKNAGLWLGVRTLIQKWEMPPADNRNRDTLTKQSTWITVASITLTMMILNEDFQATKFTAK